MKSAVTMITVSAVAMAGVWSQAMAEEATGDTILLYGNTYNLKLNLDDVTKRHMNAGLTSGQANLRRLSDRTELTVNWTEGVTTVVKNPEKDWKNQAALDELNSAMGLNVQAQNVNDMDFVGAMNGSGARTSITLDFSKNDAIGDDLTFYIFAMSPKGQVHDFEISGLNSITLTSASGTKTTGFDGSKGGYGSMTLFKISGTLDNTRMVTFLTDAAATAGVSDKAGFAMIAYRPTPTIPEPATATLSLLALAGLAARRRRK